MERYIYITDYICNTLTTNMGIHMCIYACVYVLARERCTQTPKRNFAEKFRLIVACDVP